MARRRVMKISIVDIETSGLEPSIHKILEVGIALLDLDNGSIKTTYDSVVGWPPCPYLAEAWVFKNSTITYDEVLEAPKWEDQKDAIAKALNLGDLVTAYNKKFDITFLAAHGISIPGTIQAPCPMLRATPLLKLTPKSAYYAAQPNTWKWPSVTECTNFLFPDEDFVEAHRGADDARAEARIVNELYNRKLMGNKNDE